MMKGFLALVFVLVLAITGFNYWQVQELRKEVALLKAQLADQRAGSISDAAVTQAAIAIAKAREAIGKTNIEDARNALSRAKDYLTDARKTASTKAAPTVKWLQDQAAELKRQMEDKSRQ